MARTRPVPRVHDIAAVIFDLDGVLVDSEPIHFRAANRVLARYGQSIDETHYRRYIGLGERATWTLWRDEHGIADTVDHLLAEHTAARLKEIAAGVPAVDPAVQLARRLHAAGMPLAIASSSIRAVIDALLHALALDAVFPIRISGEDANVRVSKPAPDIYLEAAARLGVAAERCLAIEDSGPGVCAAARAGMQVVAVPNRWTADQDFRAADVVLESLQYFSLLVVP
jgi:HAD superfamily hydrolase (TIGR01509 family)